MSVPQKFLNAVWPPKAVNRRDAKNRECTDEMGTNVVRALIHVDKNYRYLDRRDECPLVVNSRVGETNIDTCKSAPL
jgi:hypothetical protein